MSVLTYDSPSDYRHLQQEIISEEMPQAIALGTLLLKTFGKKSVIDIGCGPGIYLLPYKQSGCEVYGVDGCDAAGAVLDATEFELVDLRNPWTPPKEFGMSLCIEVAEHLPPKCADTLMDTLCKCAPLCFFSAARPTQGGCGHFNCQTKEYWLEKFAVRGFALDKETTKGLHVIIDNDPVYERCQWLRWNSMVIKRL